jgi:hypothetical protein
MYTAYLILDIYVPYYVSGDQKGTEHMAGNTGRDIK